MKKSKKLNKKLSLSKVTIATLINPQKVWGGISDDDGTDDTQNPQNTQKNNTVSPKKAKCKENSQKVIWE